MSNIAKYYADNVILEDQQAAFLKLDEFGNLLTSSTPQKDASGRTSFNSLFGDSVTGKRITQVSVKFNAGIIQSQVNITGLNGGTATESNSRLFLQTSTATNGSIVIESRDKIRYRPGHDLYGLFTYAWTNGGVTGSKQFIGEFDSLNGYFLGFNGTTFVVGRRQNGVDFYTNRDNFLDKLDGFGKSGFNINFTNINAFRVSFGYLGILPAVFEVYAGYEKGWVSFAYIDLVNTTQNLTIENPNLPIRIELIKTSGATNLIGYSGSWDGGYINGGDFNIGNISNGYNTGLGITVTPVSPSDRMAVVTFRLKTTFNGKTNTANAKLIHSNLTNNATGDIILGQIIANPTSVGATAVGSLAYSDISATNSTVEYSNSAGIITGGQVIFSEYMLGTGVGGNSGAGEGQINFEEIGLIGKPGDIFTVAYTRISGTGAYKAFISMNWIELF